MNFISKNIPLEMKEKNQWVCYFKKKIEGSNHLGKVMVSPITFHHARSNEKSDWTDFYKANLFLKEFRNADGLAFVLTEGIVFIDIDNSIDKKGNINDVAKKLLETFPDTYAERSCSGRGIHIFLKGNLPPDCMKRNDEIGLEMYDTKRFCCVTGDIISSTNELHDYSSEIKKLSISMMGRKVINDMPKAYYGKPSISDQEIISKAMRSKSGNKFSRLYSGDTSGYASASSADLALVAMIAFYTQDKNQIDHIFRMSGLYREKWDSPRGDSTYGMMTIEKSLSNTKRVYEME